MRYLNNINNVVTFFVIKNNVYTFSLDGKLSKFLNFKKEWEVIINTQYFLKEIGENIICSWSQFSCIVFFDAQSGKVLIETNVSFRPIKFDDNWIYGMFLSKNIDGSSEFSFGKLNHELEPTILIELSDFAPIFFWRDRVICTNKVLTCHPLSTGEEKWRIDIGDIGKYLRLGEMTQGSVHSMEAHENVLCVALGNDVILGIDIETGKTIWQRQMTLMTGLPYTFSEGKLYCFSLEKIGGVISNEGVNYHVFDMQTGAEEVHVFPTPFDTPLGFTKPTIAGNLLLTTDVYARKIYLMDKYTAVVQETITLEGEGDRIPIDNSPQLHGNRLYQLDGDRVLHIFEREMV